MGVPNRMAVEGEQLVVHRFRTGSLGLAAPDSTNPPTRRPNSFWVRLKLFFTPTQRDSVRTVCMPPGAQLVVEDIPEYLHLAIGVGEIELATFTRIKAPGAYRDAVRFKKRARSAVAGASRRPAHVGNEPFPPGLRHLGCSHAVSRV